MNAEDHAYDDLRLAELHPGQNFQNAVFALVSKKVGTTKAGAPFLTLRVRDCTGQRNGRWFNLPSGAEQSLDGAALVALTGSVDANGNFSGDLKITSAVPVAAPEDLTPYLMPMPGQHQAHLRRFAALLKSVKQPHLAALLRAIFEGPIWTQFSEAPAARNMHHSHRGGLLEHCGEVATLCDQCASTLPHLNRDLLVTGAMLHDIGKLEEMESGLRSGEYTLAGQLVGHVVLGTYTVTRAADSLEDFPPALLHELMHLILSHHGRAEHGAARPPLCAEAVVLSLCDLMSARVAQCYEAAGNGNEEPFQRIFGWDDGSIYLAMMQNSLKEHVAQELGPV